MPTGAPFARCPRRRDRSPLPFRCLLRYRHPSIPRIGIRTRFLLVPSNPTAGLCTAHWRLLSPTVTLIAYLVPSAEPTAFPPRRIQQLSTAAHDHVLRSGSKHSFTPTCLHNPTPNPNRQATYNSSSASAWPSPSDTHLPPLPLPRAMNLDVLLLLFFGFRIVNGLLVNVNRADEHETAPSIPDVTPASATHFPVVFGVALEDIRAATPDSFMVKEDAQQSPSTSSATVSRLAATAVVATGVAMAAKLKDAVVAGDTAPDITTALADDAPAPETKQKALAARDHPFPPPNDHANSDADNDASKSFVPRGAMTTRTIVAIVGVTSIFILLNVAFCFVWWKRRGFCCAAPAESASPRSPSPRSSIAKPAVPFPTARVRRRHVFSFVVASARAPRRSASSSASSARTLVDQRYSGEPTGGGDTELGVILPVRRPEAVHAAGRAHEAETETDGSKAAYTSSGALPV
ncbi:hypothetical protein MKEN_00384300 [Mycena kentingensis (nom. inval.)]|nr:hypothetical protein MKEN_00384300 [Mycena kentingensis (nom. inval.)]